MKKIKHSKFKNTGILFELLVRQITFEVLNGDNNEKAQKILKQMQNDRNQSTVGSLIRNRMLLEKL